MKAIILAAGRNLNFKHSQWSSETLIKIGSNEILKLF